MHWIALHLPRPGLDVLERGLADPPPLALDRQGRIALANAAAQARGVEAGQPRATALAVLPSLQLQERDPGGEARALAQIADWALQFTPGIIVQPPTPSRLDGELLLDVEASLRLFGGLERLLERLRDGLQALGYSARLGAAPTAAAAGLLARWQDGRVIRSEARLPVDLGRLPIALMASFETGRSRDTARGIGLRVLGDLLQLPRNGLARRFGLAVLQEIDQILGRQPDARPWHVASAAFDRRLELLADVCTAPALAFALQRLLAELAGWLAARHAAVRHLRVEALHDRRRADRPTPPTVFEARFATPTREAARMMAVLHERLLQWPLPAPAHTLRLRCDEIVAADGAAASLFPAAADAEEQLGRLIERLQARLGPQQVQRILLAADHRPESAYRIEALALDRAPATSALPSTAASVPPSPLLARTLRPLWLLRPPLPLAERRQRPWHHGPLRLVSGPERIEGGWWDDDRIQRDYFIAEDDQGQWLWIYRTRGLMPARPGATRPDASAAAGQWFLQGRFG